MADLSSLAVGLYLNDAFTPKLAAVYRQAGDQSRRFIRGVQQDTKKAEVAYQHLASAIGGVASRLAWLAGVGLSLGAVIHTSRQYSQALSDLSAITGATGEALKKTGCGRAADGAHHGVQRQPGRRGVKADGVRQTGAVKHR